VRLARLLSLYPPPLTSSVVEIGTAGGPSRVFLVRDAVDVWAVTEDREVGPKLADVLVSPIEEEVLVKRQADRGARRSPAGPGLGEVEVRRRPG